MKIQISNVNNKPTTTSLDVAEKFDKNHGDLLKRIRKLIDAQPEFGAGNITPSSYTTAQNKEAPCYILTRDGFTMVSMSLSGPKAIKWKIKYINAFNAMEQKILKSHGELNWNQARQQIKGVRKSITDTIKDFVEYATNQGSKSANHYYSNITKMEYKALELTQAYKKAKGEKCNFRDALDLMDISFLSAAEWVARNAIQEGMDRKLPYKDIYMLTKDRVIAYADTVNINRLN